jgi:hypothetical protein
MVLRVRGKTYADAKAARSTVAIETVKDFMMVVFMDVRCLIWKWCSMVGILGAKLNRYSDSKVLLRARCVATI